MTYIFIKHTNVLVYAFIVCALHINVTFSQIVYEHPYYNYENYDDYFSHPPLIFNTRKLNVVDYYLSVHNAFDRRIPLATEVTYDMYRTRYYGTRSTSIEIQKQAYKDSSLIEKMYLDRKIYDTNKSYHITSAEYYEMNKNYIQIVAIKRMIKMMSISESNDEQFDNDLIKKIEEQDNYLTKPSPPPKVFCHPVFMSFRFGKSKSTVEKIEKNKMPLNSFRQNYNELDYSANTTVNCLSQEQFEKIRHLMTLLPTKDETITSYKEKFTYLLKFKDENSKNISQRPTNIDKLSHERIEALRSKYPLKNETYNFYLVRSKVYGFIPFHFKFCQDRLNVFKNEKEADVSSLFGISKSQSKPTN